MSVLRLSRIALVAAVAFFFTLVAFGNITDYGANWKFVTHVLSMDTTFRDPDVMWRAVTDPTLQRAAYAIIIGWQCLTAVLLWIGVARLAGALRADRDGFAAARGVAVLGLTAGLLLYAVGFLVIAGEWFAMWQSRSWNGQATAGIFVLFIGVALLHLCGPEPEWRQVA
ncbi:MAG TPA: DUF2165 domain-containing protein [Geminicoccaceae bacterium]|nr:DUF2165 domain-containing protein [Geminicoccaceae bacterium]